MMSLALYKSYSPAQQLCDGTVKFNSTSLLSTVSKPCRLNSLLRELGSDVAYILVVGALTSEVSVNVVAVRVFWLLALFRVPFERINYFLNFGVVDLYFMSWLARQ